MAIYTLSCASLPSSSLCIFPDFSYDTFSSFWELQLHKSLVRWLLAPINSDAVWRYKKAVINGSGTVISLKNKACLYGWYFCGYALLWAYNLTFTSFPKPLFFCCFCYRFFAFYLSNYFIAFFLIDRLGLKPGFCSMLHLLLFEFCLCGAPFGKCLARCWVIK